MATVNGIDLVFKKIPETTHKAIIDGDEVIPFAGPDGTFYYITRDELFSQLGGITSGFVGVLYISDTPTEDGMYLAAESGEYVNAGNIEVDLSDGLTFIVKEGSNYDGIVIPIENAVDGLVQPGDDRAVSGDTVYNKFIEELYLSPIDLSGATSGRISPGDGSLIPSGSYQRLVGYTLSEKQIYYKGTIGTSLTCAAAYYDSNGDFISAEHIGTEGTTDLSVILSPPSNAVTAGFTWLAANPVVIGEVN